MNILSALSIISCMLYLMMGVYAYRMFKRTTVRILFFLLCCSYSIWSFAYAFVYVTNNSVWMKISAIGWCSFSALILHLTADFTGIKRFKSKVLQVALYLPAVLFLYLSIFEFGPDRQPSKWLVGFFGVSNFIYNFSYLFISILFVAIWGVRSKNKQNRLQTRIIIIASLIPFILNLFTQVLLPIVGIQSLPPIGQLYSLILMAGLFYVNYSFGLFSISTELLFNQILAEMMDVFFLLSVDGRILKVNNRTNTLLQYEADELLQVSVYDIFTDAKVLERLMNFEIITQTTHYAELDCRAKRGNLIPMKLSCSPIFNSKTKELLGRVIIGHDISITRLLKEEIAAHKQSEQMLRESEQKFRAMFDKHAAVMLLVDPDTQRIYAVNEAAQRFYGYSNEAFTHLRKTELAIEQGDEMNKRMADLVNQDRSAFYTKHRLANGEVRDVEIHSSPVPINEKTLIYSIIHDVTERSKAEKYISYLAYHDSLTGLLNRKSFVERLEQELVHAEVKKDKIAVLFLDLDGFKETNDQFGHEAGDFVLCEVGQRIKRSISETDVIARLGGDEYAILLLNIQQLSQAQEVAHKIDFALENCVQMKNIELNCKGSIGIALFPEDGSTVDSLLQKADIEMYKMKRERKGTHRNEC